MSAHPYADVLSPDLFTRRRHPLLTDRQYECIELLAQGLTNREIAARLAVSPSTASVHIHRCMQHAGISDRSRHGSSARRVRLVLWWLEQNGRLR